MNSKNSVSTSVLIIGAGICGLTIATDLKESDSTSAILLEKSRGVGGRMATRRTDNSKFDHGAQFYSLKPEMLEMHGRWQVAGLIKTWFEKDGVTRICAREGMTTLAKNLAKNLDIRLSEKVILIKKQTAGWAIETESGQVYESLKLVLTCPLPQSLELLKNSHINFNKELTQVTYAQALIGLFENITASSLELPHGFLENPLPEIQSIADQKEKGLSLRSSWTVTMSPEFSAQYFEESDQTSIDQIKKVIRTLDSSFDSESSQLKKWRFSHPLQKAYGYYNEVEPGLFVAGDAFGRPSLGGAVQSAKALVKFLLSST